MRTVLPALGALLVATGLGVSTMAQDTQTQQIVRKDLLTALIAGGKNIARVEIKEINLAPNQATGLHRHPIPVVGYIVAGTIRFQIEGQPVQTLPRGSAFFEPANTRIAHFDNLSPRAPAKFIAFYLLGTDDRELIEMSR
jgi:quercetin dioxygenase-like cupin family protein